MDLQLKGKRALITGGTRGIGRAIAFAFAEEGADVAICARDAVAVARTVAALKAKGGNRAISQASHIVHPDAEENLAPLLIGERPGLRA